MGPFPLCVSLFPSLPSLPPSLPPSLLTWRAAPSATPSSGLVSTDLIRVVPSGEGKEAREGGREGGRGR